MAEYNHAELNGDELQEVEIVRALYAKVIGKLAYDRNQTNVKFATQFKISEGLKSTIKAQRERIAELEIEVELSKNGGNTSNPSCEQELATVRQKNDELMTALRNMKKEILALDMAESRSEAALASTLENLNVADESQPSTSSQQGEGPQKATRLSADGNARASTKKGCPVYDDFEFELSSDSDDEESNEGDGDKDSNQDEVFNAGARVILNRIRARSARLSAVPAVPAAPVNKPVARKSKKNTVG